MVNGITRYNPISLNHQKSKLGESQESVPDLKGFQRLSASLKFLYANQIVTSWQWRAVVRFISKYGIKLRYMIIFSFPQ